MKKIIIILLSLTLLSCQNLQVIVEELDLEESMEASNYYPEEKHVDDLESFGLYGLKEELSNTTDGMTTIEYISNHDFSKIVTHFENELSNTDAFDLAEYEDYAQISGVINDVFVQFDIEKRQGQVYVTYHYENPVTLEVSLEQIETMESQMAFKRDDVLIRDEDMTIDDVLSDWELIQAPQTMYMFIEGQSKDYESGAFNFTYEVFVKNENIHVAAQTEYGETYITYNADKDSTKYQTKGVPGARYEKGKHLPIQIDLTTLKYMEASLEHITDYEEEDGRHKLEVMYHHEDTLHLYTFDLDKKILIQYTEMGMEMYYSDDYPDGISVPYSVTWTVTELQTDITVEDQLFD